MKQKQERRKKEVTVECVVIDVLCKMEDTAKSPAKRCLPPKKSSLFLEKKSGKKTTKVIFFVAKSGMGVGASYN